MPLERIHNSLSSALATERIEIRDSGEGRGRGVFAKTPFAAGETIEFAPVLIMRAEDREHLKRTHIYNYFFQWGAQGQTALALGYGSIYNHSETPNAKHVREFEKMGIRFVALRPILTGEEIFVNYLGNYHGRARNKDLWF